MGVLRFTSRQLHADQSSARAALVENEFQMKYIRKHVRVDNLGKQQRANVGSWGRIVYLALLGLFSSSIVYYLIGDAVVLSADGIVLKDRYAVDAAYPAKVTHVFVKAGDKVEPGTLLVELESFDMVKEIAELLLRQGELAVREGQLHSRHEAIQSVMPLAERTARETRTTLARIDTIVTAGIVSTSTKDEAVRGSFQAAEHLADLTGQLQATKSELALVAQFRARSGEAMDEVKAIYDGGNIRSVTEGVVGAKVPVPGQVLRFGDPLLQIDGGKSYVLAYLPDNYLFSLREGMAVDVGNGTERARGTVEKILSVADALPDEFQNMFRPRDRSRLIRIALDESNSFAVSQKVSVSGCAFGFCWAR
ncbi:HlyD family efflux transporter periplasmic adaptor subunit [Mesorhizobium sp. M0898]|uniref:HlyD family secretion protein n=1 Tax=Mesorhizobium sp. M0898 TaxID=2957020 RepID=UPI003334B8D8